MAGRPLGSTRKKPVHHVANLLDLAGGATHTGHMMPSREACLAAVAGRDERFDGVFFTGVTSTGIFCRPSCPAITPKPANIVFHPSAASAQAAGFRACKRCRPDAVPGSPEWDVRADTLARAVRLIGDGLVDREGVAGLAARLGYTPRQLQRLTAAELGASPLTLARAQRAHSARVLLETTDLPVSEVAFAAGFGSIRSFNDAIGAFFGGTPTALRGRTHGRRPETSALATLHLRLSLRSPFNPTNVFGHLAATAVPGVEEWRDGEYRRTLRLPHGPGIVALSPRADHVATTLHLTDPRDLTPAIGRCRRLLDLDADPIAVDTALAADPVLAPLVAAGPGRRVPRTVDGDEFALRAVIGQQVSTVRAQNLARRLVSTYGDPVFDPIGGLTHLFPRAANLTGLEPADLPGPAARRNAFVRLARALAAGDIDLSPGADRAAARAALAAIPGIGPWTVEIVAMRSLGDPDAFPATDLGVRRAAAELGLTQPVAAAERWRPWRAYAVQYLWAVDDHPINHLPNEDQ